MFSTISYGAYGIHLEIFQGDNYLSGVCTAYLAAYRFLKPTQKFSIDMSKRKSELDKLWIRVAEILGK